jgi:hypothetical protein
VVERFDVLALAGVVLVGEHALEVEAENLPPRFGHRLVRAHPQRFLLLGLGSGRASIQDGERPLELGGRGRPESERAELRVDGVKILQGSRWSELDLELAGERLLPGDFGVHGVERELAHRPLALFHGASDPVLAEGEELDEGPPLAESLHDLAGGTFRPVRGSRARGYGAFVLFALVHSALRLAETLHGEEPSAVRFAFAKTTRIAGPEQVAVRRVEVVVDHVSLPGGTERVGAQGAQVEQRVEHGRV